ncbi:MAG TPA: hypothetical protein VFM88_17675 [Vicinamibacteria bacterium]|nr:hypothetical protein [Vicinamibacteria bacterium]
MRNDKLLMAAIAGITLGVTASPRAIAADKDEVKCWGINACGSHAKCSVGEDDLAAFKALLGAKEFAAKFGKSEAHGCGSHASCGGSSQILNWTTATAGECKAKGGYLVETKDGKKVAKKA